ncbi:MAG: hypothetical protein ALECFALPRED_003926 [Alectoria fallacina]|uniref:Heterokaryon incompatibility domain-containing protein n=1 Tax=Alectoria fallacina TaxID=1903189 RepID=A0A8H3FQA3_9LECA|nr:MAG: hypothetical protein ALECFALPRED_003926 [Alectoria fallacina]
MLGDSPLPITENLKSALHRIRGPNRPKNLWVDAFFINQNDFEEKNGYEKMVWLGEKSADSDLAMDSMWSLRQWTPVQLDSGSDANQITL